MYLLLLSFLLFSLDCLDIQISPQDPRFYYKGRWILNGSTFHGLATFADWPCSSIHFQVETLHDGNFKDFFITLFHPAMVNF